MRERKSLSFYVIAMLIFGTIGIVRRYIPLPSGTLACLRGLLGSLFILFFLFFKKYKIQEKPSRKNLILLIVSGAIIGVQWGLLFEAYNYTTVAVATLCYYMAPTIIIILSMVVLHERLSVKKLICCLFSVLGMILVSGVISDFGNFDKRNLIGIALGLTAAVFYAIVVIINKKIDYKDSYVTTIVQLTSACVAILPYALIAEINTLLSIKIKWHEIFLIIVLGVVHTGISYVLYFTGVKGIGGQTIAILSYIDPVFALLLSAVLLGEVPSIAGTFGAILIIGSSIVSEVKFLKGNK